MDSAAKINVNKLVSRKQFALWLLAHRIVWKYVRNLLNILWNWDAKETIIQVYRKQWVYLGVDIFEFILNWNFSEVLINVLHQIYKIFGQNFKYFFSVPFSLSLPSWTNLMHYSLYIHTIMHIGVNNWDYPVWGTGRKKNKK